MFVLVFQCFAASRPGACHREAGEGFSIYPKALARHRARPLEMLTSDFSVAATAVGRSGAFERQEAMQLPLIEDGDL
jgi:hypothetical protein